MAGWTEATGADPDERDRASSAARGVQRFVYTNVDRDGMLEGPDLDEVRAHRRARSAGGFLYSGGIGSLDDLRALARAAAAPLAGVICGKALYEGRFGVREAPRSAGARALTCCSSA